MKKLQIILRFKNSTKKFSDARKERFCSNIKNLDMDDLKIIY